MPPRSRFRAEPACQRCGNEEDLYPWDTGAVFCAHCLNCAHGHEQTVNHVCTLCLRQLYTLWTFEGPMIRDLDLYLRAALREYGLFSFELQFWRFDEQELALQDAEHNRQPVDRKRVVRAVPPHHRF